MNRTEHYELAESWLLESVKKLQLPFSDADEAAGTMEAGRLGLVVAQVHATLACVDQAVALDAQSREWARQARLVEEAKGRAAGGHVWHGVKPEDGDEPAVLVDDDEATS